MSKSLDDVVRVLCDIQALIERTIEKGYTQSETLYITARQQSVTFREPLFTLILINDGPGSILYMAPASESNTFTEIKSTETITLNFSVGTIKKAVFRAADTTGDVTCKLRLIGTY